MFLRERNCLGAIQQQCVDLHPSKSILAFQALLDAVVMPLAAGLPILLIPKAPLVAVVRKNVIDSCRSNLLADRSTAQALGIGLQVSSPFSPPPMRPLEKVGHG